MFKQVRHTAYLPFSRGQRAAAQLTDGHLHAVFIVQRKPPVILTMPGVAVVLRVLATLQGNTHSLIALLYAAGPKTA